MSINERVFEHSAAGRNNRKNLEVLVVEDDDFSRKLITKSLKEYEVKEAADGEEALKQYALAAPDLVFLDIELPDITGLEILEKVNEVDENSFVVMLTSHTEEAIVKEAVAKGAKGYIAKPFEKDRITDYVQKCLQLKNG